MSNNAEHVKDITTEKTEFKREIGVFGGVSIIGGIMIGSGIFYLGSYVLQRTAMNSGLALICWIIGGIISLFGGLCYAELGAAMPKAGGRVVYLNEAFHPVVGFMSGFSDWLIGGPGSVAAIAIAMMTVFKPVVGIGELGIKVGAIIVIIVLTFFNMIGVKFASTIQNLSMIAKLIPIFVIMGVALFLGKETPDLSLGSAVTFAKDNDMSIIGMISFATIATLWAYEGWGNITAVTEEIKEPHKNLPKAMIIGIGGITVLYTLFNFAIMRVLPHNEMESLINSGNVYLGTEVARRLLGNAGVAIVTAGMIVAMFGALNGLILAQPRAYYAMAEEGHFFKCFKKLHPVYKVPTAPIICQGVFSCLLVCLRSLDQLTNLVVVTSMIFSTLALVAVPILRKKYPDIERPYKVWFYPVSVIITIVIFTALVAHAAIEDYVTGLIGLGVPAVGAVVYYIFDRRLKKDGR